MDGLKLLLGQGYDSVLIQTESLETVQIIQSRFFNDSISTLVRRI